MVSRACYSGFILLLAILTLPGCYGRRIYEIEARLDETQREIEMLEDSLATVAFGVAQLDSTVGRSSTPVRANRALLQSRLDELQTRIEILESLVKENRYKLSKLSMGRQLVSTGDTLPAIVDTSIATATLATHIYQTAYADFMKGNFQAAISGFRDFVKRYPSTDFSDDAQFMIGQSYYALGEYDNAINEFRKVIDDYPTADRVPEAMYRLALCYAGTGDVLTARQYLELLVNQYPTTVEARQAEEQLKQLPPPPEQEE